jgi:hypothetical protein
LAATAVATAADELGLDVYAKISLKFCLWLSPCSKVVPGERIRL